MGVRERERQWERILGPRECGKCELEYAEDRCRSSRSNATAASASSRRKAATSLSTTTATKTKTTTVMVPPSRFETSSAFRCCCSYSFFFISSRPCLLTRLPPVFTKNFGPYDMTEAFQSPCTQHKELELNVSLSLSSFPHLILCIIFFGLSLLSLHLYFILYSFPPTLLLCQPFYFCLSYWLWEYPKHLSIRWLQNLK